MITDDFLDWLTESKGFLEDGSSPNSLSVPESVNGSREDPLATLAALSGTRSSRTAAGTSTGRASNKRKRVVAEDEDDEEPSADKRKAQNRNAAAKYRVKKMQKASEMEEKLTNLVSENARLQQELERSQKALAWGKGTEDVSILYTRLQMVKEELFSIKSDDPPTVVKTKLESIREKNNAIREQRQALLEKAINMAIQYSKPFKLEAAAVQMLEVDFVDKHLSPEELKSKVRVEEEEPSLEKLALSAIRQKFKEELDLSVEQQKLLREKLIAFMESSKRDDMCLGPPLTTVSNVTDVLQRALHVSKENYSSKNKIFSIIQAVLKAEQSVKLMQFIHTNPGLFSPEGIPRETVFSTGRFR